MILKNRTYTVWFAWKPVITENRTYTVWFAWKPVITENGQITWLRYIKRSCYNNKYTYSFLTK